ncbi:MAG TPA: choice-of-anchor U domain-containing protein, partial [Cellvibrio sp.]
VLLVRPGHHLLKWKATNAAGVTGEASQVVNVKPLVSLSKSQVAVRGSTVEFRVLLNGPSPVYPLSIPYVVDASSTATTQEHNLVSGTATFTQPGQVEVVVPVSLAAVTGFSDSQLVVALGDGINAGASKRHVIDIRQGNVPPIVTLSITQGGFNTSLITPSGGPVTVTATVTDLNPGDTHSFDWSATTGLADTDGNPTNAVRVFSPAGLNGSNQVKVTVTDSGGASVQASAYFRVVSVLPVLSPNTDTDQDGIDDDLEGTGDSDDNGIPDYLDNMPSTNILPQQGNTTNSYLIECDPGVRCGLGLFARTSTSGGVQILNDELGTIPNIELDKVFEPVGGVFDFAIRDLPTPGQAVRVVVPQRAAIPANATYRKFQRGRWVSFVVDADNTIHSAAGNPGYCPPPGSDDWTPGLTAGHLCVQLTIKDGGPNDDDGLVNSAVVDPGAVSVALEIPEPPEPPKPPVEIKTDGGGGSIQGLWVLLLGGLLMVKRVFTKGKAGKVKMIAVLLGVATVLASIATQAATGPYVRVDVANVSTSQREEDFTAALAAANYDLIVDRYDTNRTGYQLALGYQWDPHASTEIGYLDLGKVEVDLTVAGETNLGTIPWHIGQEYPLSPEGFTLVQGLTLNPADKFRIIGEIGIFIWRSEVDVENDVISIKRDRGEDPVVGVRFELPVQEQFGLGLGVRRIYFDTQEADLVSLTGTFRF